MNRVMREAIKGFELYYPEIAKDAVNYYEDRLGYLVIEMRDGNVFIYDDENSNLMDRAKFTCKQDFGTRLRLIMRRRHVTQKELSEKSGISVSTISHYMNCQRSPSFEVACLLANALDCSIEDFRYIDPRKRKRLI